MEPDLPTTPAKFADFNNRNIIGTLLAGLAAGLVTIGVSRLLEHYAIPNLFCRGADQAACAGGGAVALHIGAIVGAIVAVIIMARVIVYRPLLIAILVTVGLWKFSILTLGLPWLSALLILAATNLLAYFAFAWLVRIHNIILALILSIGLALAMLLASFIRL